MPHLSLSKTKKKKSVTHVYERKNALDSNALNSPRQSQIVNLFPEMLTFRLTNRAT